MDQLSEVKLEIAGKAFTIFNRVRVSQWIDRHHSFELSIPLEAVEGADGMKINKSKDFVGKEVLISVKYRQGSSLSFTFKGFITQVFLSKQSVSGSAILIRGFSASILLEHGNRYAAFYEKNHKDIVKKILANYDQSLLRPDINPKNDKQEDYVVQFEESTFNFLHRFAASTGNWFFYDGAKIIFGDVKGESPIELAYGVDIQTFDMRMDLPTGKFMMDDWNYKKSEQEKSHSDDVSVSGLGEYGQFLIDQSSKIYPERKFMYPPLPVFSTSEVKAQVGYEKKASVANAVIFTGSSSKIGLKVGAVIDIKERSSRAGQKTESFGQYRIISISHEMDLGGGYSNRFEAIPAGVEFRANPSFYVPRATPQVARVTHNDDPDKLGRVRVVFLWQTAQGDTESSAWMRVLAPYSGVEDQGHYFVPEVESILLCTFENDDPARPIGMGNIFYSKNKPGAWFNKDNYKKAIVTQGKNHIIINDEPGKETIEIYNKDKKNCITLSLDDTHITIKSEGNINLEATGDITMKAKNLNIDIEKDICMTAGGNADLGAKQDYSITGQNLSLEAMTNLKAKGRAGVAIETNATLEAKGTIVTIEAQAKAEIKASAMLEINGGAMAVLKGAMVMIN